eukprot:5273775-Prymnesium_polylepis.1
MFPPTNQLPKCAARAGLVMVTAPTAQTAVALAHTTMKADRPAAEKVRSGRCGRSGSDPSRGGKPLRAPRASWSRKSMSGVVPALRVFLARNSVRKRERGQPLRVSSRKCRTKRFGRWPKTP